MNTCVIVWSSHSQLAAFEITGCALVQHWCMGDQPFQRAM